MKLSKRLAEMRQAVIDTKLDFKLVDVVEDFKLMEDNFGLKEFDMNIYQDNWQKEQLQTPRIVSN